jgi:hypothetical protein
MDFKLEQERSELRAMRLRALMESSDWKFYVEEMKSQIEEHKNFCVSAVQQGKLEDAKRQAYLVLGIEEALEHPASFVSYHENTFRKIGKQVCNACGNLVRWVNKSDVRAA